MTQTKFSRRPFETSLDSLVDDLFAELPVLFKNGTEQYNWKSSVPVNITETASGYKVEVIAPGFEKSDFKVNLEKDLLTISAETKNRIQGEGEKQVRNEYNYRSFKRSFTIDEKIDATKTEASYVNGVLTLNLPKKEEVKVSPTEITIQ